jgi:hypothetical protein
MTSPRPETSDTRRLANITEGVIPPRQSQRHSAMAADVLSPRSEPSVTSPNANRTSLPPLVTSPPSKAKLERASSYVSKRLSTFSNASASQSVSRLCPARLHLFSLFFFLPRGQLPKQSRLGVFWLTLHLLDTFTVAAAIHCVSHLPL